MAKCPQCGYQPKMGRPAKLDPAKVKSLVKKGLSNVAIGEKLGATEGAVRALRKRECVNEL